MEDIEKLLRDHTDVTFAECNDDGTAASTIAGQYRAYLRWMLEGTDPNARTYIINQLKEKVNGSI